MAASSAGATRGVTEEVRGAARDVLDEARATANALKSEAGGLAGTIKEGLASKAEQQKNVVADRLGQSPSHLQKSAGDLREHEAWLATLIERGARELEHVADDIKRNDIAGIMGSAEVFARRQPALFMGAAVALGFALTRVVRTSASPVTITRPTVALRRRWTAGLRSARPGVRLPGVPGPLCEPAGSGGGRFTAPIDERDRAIGDAAGLAGAGTGRCRAAAPPRRPRRAR